MQAIWPRARLGRTRIHPRVVTRTATTFAAVLLAAALFVPATVTAGGPAFTFKITLGSGCATGTGPPLSSIDLTLLDRDGHVIDRDTAESDSSGAWNSDECFWYSARPTDRIRAQAGAEQRTLKLPNITAVVDRVGDVVSGSAPTAGTFELRTRLCPQIWTCFDGPTANVNVAANGTYARDVTSLADLRGRDQVTARWISGNGDEVLRGRTVPYMQIEVLDAGVFGVARPGEEVTIRLRTGAGDLLGKGSDVGSSTFGSFGVELETSGGLPAYPRPGHKAKGTFASDASFTVPTISLSATSTMLSGTCLPNAPVYVYLEDPDTNDWTEAYDTTGAGGNFTVAVADTSDPSFVPTSGQRWEVDCRTSKGDIASRYAHLS